jgi:hypothetical protein
MDALSRSGPVQQPRELAPAAVAILGILILARPERAGKRPAIMLDPTLGDGLNS